MKKPQKTLILIIKVVPSSGRQQLKLDKSGILKCFIKSAPERGLANDEVIKFLASQLSLPKSAITILSGQTARSKRISITTALSKEEIFKQLGIQIPENQLPLNFKGG
jgi:hypothetical protein